MALGRGLTLGILDAVSIGVNNEFYLWLGAGSIGSIPISLIFVIILYILFNNILQNTILGKQVYAIGGNRPAARASGIKTKWLLTFVYTFNGMMAGLASIITVGG